MADRGRKSSEEESTSEYDSSDSDSSTETLTSSSDLTPAKSPRTSVSQDVTSYSYLSAIRRHEAKLRRRRRSSRVPKPVDRLQYRHSSRTQRKRRCAAQALYPDSSSSIDQPSRHNQPTWFAEQMRNLMEEIQSLKSKVEKVSKKLKALRKARKRLAERKRKMWEETLEEDYLQKQRDGKGQDESSDSD